jgi:DNA-binding PadR family transcriptional regulator
VFGYHHHHRWGGERSDNGDCRGRGMRRGHGPWGRHGWGEGGPGRGHWGGGRERPLEQGDLKFLLLDLISQQPRHGYELIKAIEEAMEGGYSPSPGVIYPTLTLLEDMGLVTAETQGSKKLYSVTDEGRAYLEAEKPSVDAARERLEEARRRFGPGRSPEIGRAMKNLGMALAGRLSRGALTQEELRRVTDALDEAAKAIERS